MIPARAEDFPALIAKRKSGSEQFRHKGRSAGFDLLDFWQWSVSDLVSNASRGILAEYIVAKALGLTMDIRNQWDAFDLRTESGLKVEVKSAAYVQAWFQRKLSSIVFRVGPRRLWESDTNIQGTEPKWQADVYVFAVLTHQEKSTVDPMNLDQWDFYVVGVSALKNRERSQHSITFRSLCTLCPAPVKFGELKEAILKAGS